jgi:threonylcarbamoyladenosine tRNA methylthiotransferase MtaB
VQRFFVQNFGCRASQADGAAIEAGLGQQGLIAAAEPASADWVVLNTCTVTANADDDLRQSVRRVHRENPSARILVTGCYAQRAPQEIAALPGVTMVVGNSHKTHIPELILGTPRLVQIARMESSFHGEIHVGDIFAQHDFLAAPIEDASGDRSRPNLKIQDGCGNRCSFCIIPSVRGRSRSMPLEDVIRQVLGLTAAGYPEVVLSGINLGRWGRESGFQTSRGPLRLSGLVKILLDETPVARLRLSSVEPMDFTGELLELMADSPRIARHVHAPLQSGSDTVLRRMHRKYRPRHYEDRIRLAHRLMPDAAIGADVMTGFPGETDAEFEESYRFIENLPFTYLHVFTYSERPGTPAAAHVNPVPMATRKLRNRNLRDLAASKNLAFRKAMIGRAVSAVTLDGGTRALTSNYVPVELAQTIESRHLIDCRITGATTSGLTADLISC